MGVLRVDAGMSNVVLNLGELFLDLVVSAWPGFVYTSWFITMYVRDRWGQEEFMLCVLMGIFL